MMPEIVVGIFSAVLFLLLALYWHLKHHFSIFERLSIPGPKPSLLVGNLREIMKKGQFQATVDWTQKYGRVFGYFEGYTPVLSVSDPDLLREILVKDANNFNHRKPFPLAPRKSLGLFLENGAQWHRSRSLLTPAFSSGKLKQMLPIMNSSANVLVRELSSRRKETSFMDVYQVFQSLTLDIIGRCAFGLQTSAQTDDKDEFLVNIRSLFTTMSTTFVLPLVMAFPFLSHFIFALKNVVCLFGMNPVVWLRLKLREIIQLRKDMGPNSKVVDLVQLMLFPSSTPARDDPDLPMSEREIVAQSMTFLLAGYETTSAVLAFLSRALAEHPDVQSRLLEEVDSLKGKELNYETLNGLPYFDMVFDEVCRLYPTASQIVTRQAADSRVVKGLHIPAGMNIHANIWALHHDPCFWNQPEVFDPERFSPKNREQIQPFTFLPFGAGPRKCIGMRFAMMETKLAMVRVLQSFSFSLEDGHKAPMELIARGAIVPKHEVNIRVTKRPLPPRRQSAPTRRHV
ncbi:cytochrome P450 3A4-like [Babylonia areolata]|uniref:cytochrome P450 3A4-like n=1 Tax=Babylonia areolata TaxID=304850 RepID=UPI003FD5A19F